MYIRHSRGCMYEYASYVFTNVSDVPVFVQNSLGNLIILMGNFKFTKDYAWGNKVRYKCNQCKRHKCKASIISTVNNEVTRIFNQHNHM